MMTPIFRWNGTYVGFLRDGWFFQANARYLGWVEADGSVWRHDGRALGQLVEDHYILRNVRHVSPVPRTPRVPPLPPEPPTHPGSRIAKIPLPGWTDALEEIGRLPAAEELSGLWGDEVGILALLSDGRYTWLENDRVIVGGTWEVADVFLMIRDGDGGEPRHYGIIEFTGETLTLRWITDHARTLPFTLQRVAANPLP